MQRLCRCWKHCWNCSQISWASCKLRLRSWDFILGNVITWDQIWRERTAKDHVHVFTVQTLRLLVIVSPDERAELPAICEMVLRHLSRTILGVFSSIYLCNQWRVDLNADTYSPEIYACLSRTYSKFTHGIVSMSFSDHFVRCLCSFPDLKLTWIKCSSNKP